MATNGYMMELVKANIAWLAPCVEERHLNSIDA